MKYLNISYDEFCSNLQDNITSYKKEYYDNRIDVDGIKTDQNKIDQNLSKIAKFNGFEQNKSSDIHEHLTYNFQFYLKNLRDHYLKKNGLIDAEEVKQNIDKWIDENRVKNYSTYFNVQNSIIKD